MIIAGFMFCVGVLLFFVCVALALTLWKEILIAIGCLIGGAMLLAVCLVPDLKPIAPYVLWPAMAAGGFWLWWDEQRGVS